MRWICLLITATALAQAPKPASEQQQAPKSVSEPQPAPKSTSQQQQAALAQQQQSIRKQAESIGIWMMPGRPVPALVPSANSESESPFPCDALTSETVTPLIEDAAKAQTIDSKLVRAVIQQESGFHPCAVSPKGAKGLMQLMPDTAQQFNVKDPFDPKENIDAGTRFLKQLLDRYKGDLPQVLGAYNAGPATVDQSGGVPNIKETRDYVNSILQMMGVKPPDPQSIQMPKPIEN